MIRLEKVSKTYSNRGKTVQGLAESSFELKAGEFVAVRGPSGCGKTTMLLIAGGMLRPSQGAVFFDDLDLYSFPIEKRTRIIAEKIGFVFQRPHLIPYLTLLENTFSGGLANGIVDRDRATRILSNLGLADRLDHLPSELSEGQKQRAALARALYKNPSLLLADEPTGNLDPESARIILDAIQERRHEGAAVLLATHERPKSPPWDREIPLSPAEPSREAKALE